MDMGAFNKPCAPTSTLLEHPNTESKLDDSSITQRKMDSYYDKQSICLSKMRFLLIRIVK